MSEAFEFVNTLREHPNCRIARPEDRHWSVFSRLCEVSKAKANLVTDAWFAAIAIESGCTRVTTDRDHARSSFNP
ncbi:MAG TPA: PIN domain-containing protein [Vicinamibacteria bacterium]|nr:PIN domain-containing protein [Vicinamibacteria bacterium]